MNITHLRNNKQNQHWYLALTPRDSNITDPGWRLSIRIFLGAPLKILQSSQQENTWLHNYNPHFLAAKFCLEFIKIKNISRDSESEIFMVKCAESECRLIAWTECSLKVKCDDLTVFGSLPLCLAKHFISCREPPPSSEKDRSCRSPGFWRMPLWYQDPGPGPNCDWLPGRLAGLPWQRTIKLFISQFPSPVKMRI